MHPLYIFLFLFFYFIFHFPMGGVLVSVTQTAENWNCNEGRLFFFISTDQ